MPVVVTPALRAGLSDHHLAFPGTVSLSQDTFRGWVDAHIAGLERVGIERIAVFSGHGGNFAFIGELAAEHTSRPGPTRVIAYDDLFGFVDSWSTRRGHTGWRRRRRTCMPERSRRASASRSSRRSWATTTASGLHSRRAGVDGPDLGGRHRCTLVDRRSRRPRRRLSGGR